jgi:NTP pyrophosphatase (non-canonical NTP hydrolase)
LNINDIKLEPRKVDYDMLESLFSMQTQLMKKYNVQYPVSLHTKDGQFKLREMAWYVVEEVGEAMNVLKNRPWTNYQIPIDENHYKEELSDIMHFYIELLIMSGLSAKDMYDLYCRKHAVNNFRTVSGY